MKTYKVETTYARYTILADSFEEAYGSANELLAKERDGLIKKERLDTGLVSIVEGDEISETGIS